jgi:hypothetical protein
VWQLVLDKKTTPQDESVSAGVDKFANRVSLGANIAVIVSAFLMLVIYAAQKLDTQKMYLAQRADTEEIMRRGTTVELIGLRYQDRILNAERNINEYIVKNYHIYDAIACPSPNKRGLTVVLDAGIRSDFVLMTDFYTDIVACRESEQCQASLIDQWFKDDICQFTSQGEIVGFSQLSDQYGPKLFKPLRTFAQTNQCPPQPPCE